MPTGHLLMGYDERGRCPMLVDNRCCVYEHRPRTCRTYDCRIFPAAGTDSDGDKPLIVQRSGRWQFEHPTAADTAEHDAVRAAAAFAQERSEALPGVAPPANQTQLASSRSSLRPVPPSGAIAAPARSH